MKKRDIKKALEHIGKDKALLYLFNRAKIHRENSLATVWMDNGVPRNKTKTQMRDSSVMYQETIHSIYWITMYGTPFFWGNVVDEEIHSTREM